MDICQISNVRAELARHRVKARDLAEVLELAPRTVHNRISGATPWRVHELELVADHLGMTLDDLIGREVAS